MNGYCLTMEGTRALDLFAVDGVRFAASLDDGSGIVAFDGPGLDFMDAGTVFMVTPPDGADPTQPLPDWYRKAAPKRAIATGAEHYALISVSFEEYLHSLESVTGCVRVTDELLLVESDGPVSAGAGWSSSVVEFRDKRLELVRA
jgi:hypothetical protein